MPEPKYAKLALEYPNSFRMFIGQAPEGTIARSVADKLAVKHADKLAEGAPCEHHDALKALWDNTIVPFAQKASAKALRSDLATAMCTPLVAPPAPPAPSAPPVGNGYISDDGFVFDGEESPPELSSESEAVSTDSDSDSDSEEEVVIRMSCKCGKRASFSCLKDAHEMGWDWVNEVCPKCVPAEKIQKAWRLHFNRTRKLVHKGFAFAPEITFRRVTGWGGTDPKREYFQRSPDWRVRLEGYCLKWGQRSKHSAELEDIWQNIILAPEPEEPEEPEEPPRKRKRDKKPKKPTKKRKISAAELCMVRGIVGADISAEAALHIIQTLKKSN